MILKRLIHHKLIRISFESLALKRDHLLIHQSLCRNNLETLLKMRILTNNKRLQILRGEREMTIKKKKNKQLTRNQLRRLTSKVSLKHAIYAMITYSTQMNVLFLVVDISCTSSVFKMMRMTDRNSTEHNARHVLYVRVYILANLMRVNYLLHQR